MAKTTKPQAVTPTPSPPPATEARAIAICAAHGNQASELLEILHDIQHEIGHVPESTLPVIASSLNLSRAEVYGVITFYHDFHREPVGKHVIKICRAEACQSMGTNELCNHAQKKLAKFGETSADGKFTLEAAYCLGNCALSPAVMIDEKLYGKVDAKRFDEIVGTIAKETV
jgi:formate dehydrogenase subunit gamma